jgi:3'-phosphoadenosine 5'-phosphosulfate (PAPS) 3'-phosphatase
MPIPASLIQKAAHAMRIAASTAILPRFLHLAESDRSVKADGSIVTVADFEAESLLTRSLADLLPGSVIVGEEACATDPGRISALLGDDPVWIIDPVDGTRDFSRGDDRFGMLVSLCRKGEVIAGLAYAPALGIMAAAEAGAGTRICRDGSSAICLGAVSSGRVSVSSLVGRVNPKHLDHPVRERLLTALQDHPHIAFDTFSSWEYQRLISGEAGFYLNSHTTPWDTAAGVLLVREAGGVAGPIDGSEYHPATVAATLLYTQDIQTREQVLDRLFPGARGPTWPTLSVSPTALASPLQREMARD